MLMLAYKMALVQMIYQKRGFYPILCLDDLFSELDETRRMLVMQLLPKDLQVFITTTDRSFVVTSQKMNVFKVHQGSVTEEEI